MDTSKAIVVVEENESEMFEDMCNAYISHGYKLSSSSCDFLNSENANFASTFQAILVKRNFT